MVFSPLCVDCTYQKNLVHVRDLCVLAIWSAGAVLPLSLGEAVLRPCSVPSMALDHKSASMACALQKGVLRADFIREPGILRQFLKQRLGLLQVFGIEPLSEPAVDLGQYVACFVLLALLLP
jgi:hypothetical protein